jgi:hypothetical protein
MVLQTFGDVVIVTTPASEGLTKHPARRHVLEFLRSIVLDALALQAPNKQPVHIVDQLLEVCLLSFPVFAAIICTTAGLFCVDELSACVLDVVISGIRQPHTAV